MENYFIILLSGCLKIEKGDNLFVSMSRNNEDYVETITNIAYSLGVNDIIITYYEDNQNFKLWEQYLIDEYKFLFVVGNGWDNTLSNKLAMGLRNEDIGINYTIALSPEILFNYNNYFLNTNFKDAIIGFNKENSGYNKQINRIRNYKFNDLRLKSLSDINLTMGFDNEFRYHRSGQINIYPFNGIEMLASPSSAFGFVDASMDTIINNEKVSDLRICFEKGRLIDFDCSSNVELVKSTLKKRYELESITLIDKDYILSDFLTGDKNFLLSINANSYITLCSDDNDRIHVPIESSNLTITGFGKSQKDIKIYEKQKILII